MSVISDSTSSSSKRRLNQMDDSIEYLSQEVNMLSDFVRKKELQCSLLTLKMKREKVKALSAVARSQVILADMEVLIAESDLFTNIEKIRNLKRRLNRDEGESQTTTSQVIPTPTTCTVSVQTRESMAEKHKKRKYSSSRKSPVDNSSDETVLIPPLFEKTPSLFESSQTSQTSLSLELFEKTPANKSDSEISLSNSVKEEFSKAYTKTQEPLNKSPAKKPKTNKKDSKNKSSHVTKQSQSLNVTPKTVADLKKGVNTTSNTLMDSSLRTVNTTKNCRPNDKKSMACASYVPVRHNMPIQSPTSTYTIPFLPVNPAAQDSLQYHSQRGDNTQSFTVYGTKQ